MRNFPLFVQNRLNEFKPEYRQAFLEEFDKKKKSVFVAYLLLIPLGWHYAYLKRWGSQILCIVTFWGLLLLWIVDWFRLPSLVRKYNDDLSMDIIKGYNWVSSNPPTSGGTKGIGKRFKQYVNPRILSP